MTTLSVRRIARPKAYGTFQQGYVDVSYAKLVRTFGRPLKGDGYKTDAEWVLKIGPQIVTIYNYKTGKSYLGPKGLPVSKITRWNIGGKTGGVVHLVKLALK